MSKKFNFNLGKITSESIKQLNQSKQIDAIEKQLPRNEQFPGNYFQHDSIPQNTEKSDKQSQYIDNRNALNQKDFWTSEQKQNKAHTSTSAGSIKWVQYRSGGINSTRPTSPYNKFSTGSNFKSEQTKQADDFGIKKKLFHKEQQNSPQFKMTDSRFTNLAFTFKKKIDDYQPQFAFTQRVGAQSGKKLNFQKIDNKSLYQSDFFPGTDENDSSSVNKKSNQNQNLSDVKKRLKFCTVGLKEQNSIIKRINEQIKRDKLDNEQESKNFQLSRQNQSQTIKKKILQSRSDLSKLYQPINQNVQYEYRKAKFMDIFLGTKIIDHYIR